MTSIVSSAGLGLYGVHLPGSGNAAVGRNGQSDRVYVNAANGNLAIQAQDESLAAQGLDLSLIRTYNSQGRFTDDNWQLNVQQRLYALTGVVNTAGSAITKVYGDGHETVFSFDTGRGLYAGSDGDGPYDTLAFSTAGSEWTWTDGTQTARESYDNAGRLIRREDADGNAASFSYTGSPLTQISDASGQITYLDYTGNNLTQIRVISQGQTQTLTRYAYDTSNRLTQVTVDLTPEDNAIADGKTYVTTYTYDGASARIASITQGDGTSVSFTYAQAGGQWKLATLTYGCVPEFPPSSTPHPSGRNSLSHDSK